MATSIVNGYVCYSSCDVSRAKKGENPRPSTDLGNIEKNEGSSTGRADEPAVLFGGSLSDVLRLDSVKAVDGARPADPAASRRVGLALDILA